MPTQKLIPIEMLILRLKIEKRVSLRALWGEHWLPAAASGLCSGMMGSKQFNRERTCKIARKLFEWMAALTIQSLMPPAKLSK